jgi:pimeloyl-ACP methyl ester carboxylesterase
VSSPRWHGEVRQGTRLCCLELDGPGPAVVLLHGLAGYAEEWAETASWLSEGHRVVAVEQRGHGRSEHTPEDMSTCAFATDAGMWIERLGLAPAVVVGQSFGGLIAFLLAAQRPELVRGLAVVEATPAADPAAPVSVGRWLESWPVPFASREQALAFFDGDTAWAATWVAGLEERNDGLWPSFVPGVLVDALREASRRDWWDDWARIRCPVLVVRAQDGADSAETERMVETVQTARLVEIEGGGHDLHLEQPVRWRETLDEFLRSLDR